jgi:hypothetical protein
LIKCTYLCKTQIEKAFNELCVLLSLFSEDAIRFRILYDKVQDEANFEFFFFCHQVLCLCPLSGRWDINNAVGAIYLLREF